ncbi:hypothetical protein IMZ16_08385 [Cruoricaptor ignavus]|uniref:Uncharacterized protein n=1 Tax=Cruoricaptor ignavus TaxID=1118202 RepID=A0A7M1T2N6_9FLAO|nr:hypothetical protein [Cruoricaptor ignavus]QOR73527.1 hypothetical protein IMZ16_08385 [Cruoricaptor ignavus]
MKTAAFDDNLVKNLSLYYHNRHLKKTRIRKYHEEIDGSALHEREKFKKKSEILLLNAFLHHFPDVQFENLTCESPDFIAKVNDKKIGIELTEVINHLEIKKKESVLNKIFRKAELELENENVAEFRGIYFVELAEQKSAGVYCREAEIIADITKSIRLGRPCGAVKKLRKTPHRRNVFITYEYDLNLFDGLSSEKIISLIEKKNKKYPYYDRTVDECWLVIVSDMNSLASRYSFILNKEKLSKVQSPFHKIFHLENLCGNITAIKA